MPRFTLLVLAAVVGCQPASPAPSGDALRVVSLHDVTTEIVVALAAEDQLVGIAPPLRSSAGAEAALAEVPRVSGIESILAVAPDLVLGLGVVAEQSPELVAALVERGVEVVVAEPTSLAEVSALVAEIGAALGAEERARAVIDDFERALGPAAPRSEPVPVFVYDCCDPPFTAGGLSVLSDVIERAGGRNVFSDQRMDWGKVSWEAVVARGPALVVVHDYEWDGQVSARRKRRRLRRIPGLADVPTVELPLGQALGGLRSAEALATLRRALGEVSR